MAAVISIIPDTPMVSSEGACAAYYHFSGVAEQEQAAAS